MFSKFLRPVIPMSSIIKRKVNSPSMLLSRKIFGLIPPSQYDAPLPKRLHLVYVMKVYWETIPLFIATAVSLSICFFSIFSACNNKVDVVFTTHSRSNISRTMDLRNPSVHKLIIINQRYEPWPEMQDVLDKMVQAEKRALVRMQSCKHA